LDWGYQGNTEGNRQLAAIAAHIAAWLQTTHATRALPLHYHVSHGGLYLNDAAVLAGLGTIGASNLLLNPAYAPRIRLRVVLVERDLEPSRPVQPHPVPGADQCRHCPPAR
jgi:epoxyqueuosine reductase